ncbi:MAG: ABC transporter ATP-binding protein, partial [Cyclobacteriaceae bacterium]|nr:ABC transporter ATP-binding protein [Cyclobacteriaceae bacterium]
MGQIIRIDQLSRVYRTEEVETRALYQVSLSVEAGEFVSIMGPSGCGKSTLLNILGFLDEPSSGNFFFMETSTQNFSDREKARIRKQHIGFVFQNFNLIEELTVFENVELPLIYLGMKSAERKSRVNRMLERMDMMHRASHFPAQLSGGQQQRVAVARA